MIKKANLKRTMCMVLTMAMVISFITATASTALAALKLQTSTTLDFRTKADTDNQSTEGWKWDSATKTLTLDGLNLHVVGSSSGAITGIYLPTGSTIVLVGDSVIDANNPGNGAIGINFVSPLTVAGEGTLTITVQGGGVGSSGGFRGGGTLIVSEKAKVVVTASPGGGSSFGIRNDNNASTVRVTDNAELTLIGSSASVGTGAVTVETPNGHEIRRGPNYGEADIISAIGTETNIKIANFTPALSPSVSPSPSAAPSDAPSPSPSLPPIGLTYTYADFTFENAVVGQKALEFSVHSDPNANILICGDSNGKYLELSNDAEAKRLFKYRYDITEPYDYLWTDSTPMYNDNDSEHITSGKVRIDANVKGTGTLSMLTPDGIPLGTPLTINASGSTWEAVSLEYALNPGEEFGGFSVKASGTLDVESILISCDTQTWLTTVTGNNVSGQMRGRTVPIAYWISLPAGYNPANKYPVLFVNPRVPDAAISLWGAVGGNSPGRGIYQSDYGSWTLGDAYARPAGVAFIVVGIATSWGNEGCRYEQGIKSYIGSAGKDEFDMQGVLALFKQLQTDYSCEDQFYWNSGYSASGRSFYPIIMFHPEKIAAAFGSSTNYMGGYYDTTPSVTPFDFNYTTSSRWVAKIGDSKKLASDIPGYPGNPNTGDPSKITVPVKVIVGDNEVGYGANYDSYQALYGFTYDERGKSLVDMNALGLAFWNCTSPTGTDPYPYPAERPGRGSFYAQDCRALLQMQAAGFRNLTIETDPQGHVPRRDDSMQFFATIYNERKNGTFNPDIRDPNPGTPTAPQHSYVTGSGAPLFFTNASSYDTATYGMLQYSISGNSGTTWSAWTDYDQVNGISILGQAGVISARVRYAGTGDPKTGVGYKPSASSLSVQVTLRNKAAVPPVPEHNYVMGSGVSLVFTNPFNTSAANSYNTTLYGPLQYSISIDSGATWGVWTDYDISNGINVLGQPGTISLRVRYSGSVDMATGTGYEPGNPSATVDVVLKKLMATESTQVDLSQLLNSGTLDSKNWWQPFSGLPVIYSSDNGIGDYINYNFNGIGIEVEGCVIWWDYKFSIDIDNNPAFSSEGGFSGTSNANEINNKVLAYSSINKGFDIGDGTHTLRLVMTGGYVTCLYNFYVISAIKPVTPVLELNGNTLSITNASLNNSNVSHYGALEYSLNDGAWTAYTASGIDVTGISYSSVRLRFAGNNTYLPSYPSAAGTYGQNTPVTGVAVSPKTLTMTVGGNTQTLTAIVTPSNATNKLVSWSSSDNNIATVNQSGVVTAVSAGTAIITVTTADGNKTDTCTVNVTSVPVDTTALAAAITAANADIASVSVSVDGKDIDPANKWVTAAVKTAYQNAINAATVVLNDATATQTAVNTAVSDLAAAKTAFNTAKVKGTKGNIIVVNVVTGNGGSDVNFAIKSANGKGYSVYLSTTGAVGSFTRYADVNYNSKGIHVKGLKNGVTYYMYFEYNDGKGNISRSSIITLKPSK